MKRKRYADKLAKVASLLDQVATDLRTDCKPGSNLSTPQIQAWLTVVNAQLSLTKISSNFLKPNQNGYPK